MGSFSDQLRRITEKAQGKLHNVVGSTTVLIMQQLVQRSPVGNADGWKANANPAARRETYNTTVDAYNAETGSKIRRKGVKGLRTAFPNTAGKGYTGGRFRANWQVGVGAMDRTTSEDIDPSGAMSLGRAAAKAPGMRAGQVIVISNSLPYALRLETGWSKQAPAGVVRVTMADMPAIMAQHLRAIAQT